MMGSRCGSIDPGILLYLQREQGATAEALEHIPEHESGLKGISELSGDMRPILQASMQGNDRAQLALDLYIYRIRCYLGAMIAALEGIDVLTFTGGVGEHGPYIREHVCHGFGFLGLALNEGKNAAASGDQGQLYCMGAGHAYGGRVGNCPRLLADEGSMKEGKDVPQAVIWIGTMDTAA